MIESGLKAWGTFWIYGGMCMLATVWMFIYMKETKHLNDKEKKTLYVPDEFKERGRKDVEEEQPLTGESLM